MMSVDDSLMCSFQVRYRQRGKMKKKKTNYIVKILKPAEKRAKYGGYAGNKNTQRGKKKNGSS
jgi:hypothetical protein